MTTKKLVQVGLEAKECVRYPLDSFAHFHIQFIRMEGNGRHELPYFHKYLLPFGDRISKFSVFFSSRQVFIHLPAIHLIVSFLDSTWASKRLLLQTGMKNDKLSVQIWWHYPLVIRLPSRSLLILAYRELELEKLDLTTHYQFSVFLKTTHCIFQPMKNWKLTIF